jgi:hypothetical protein
MKTRTKVLAGLLALVLPQLANAAIHVDLEVVKVAGNDVIQVAGNSAECQGGPVDCIEVKKKSKPNIFFYLENACKSGGPDYKLTGISVSMVKGDPPSAGNLLPAVVATDLFTDSRKDGDVDLVGGNGGKNKVTDDKIKFKNKNSYPYTVYYTISAMKCDDSVEIKLDPRIQNLGK